MSKIFGSLMKTVYTVGNIPMDIKQRRLDPVKAQTKELKNLLKKLPTLHLANIIILMIY